MTNTADREAGAPRVLGREMAQTERWGWSITFGPLKFELRETITVGHCFAVLAHERGEIRITKALPTADAIAAIERELREIKKAIP